MSYNISVVGAGYVGLVTGLCLAELGHEVTIIDIDEDRILDLQEGILPIYEPGLADLLEKNSERLHFSDDYANIQYSDFVFVAVGTPQNSDGTANTCHVRSALQFDILPSLPKDKSCAVVIKSTVPVGFSGRHVPEDVICVSNPEFLREGSAVQDFLEPERIVVGTRTADAAQRMRDLYAPLRNRATTVYLDMSNESAELTKYAANAMLAVRISYMNEIANICAQVDANVDDVVQGIGTDSRIGPKFLRPGLGWGGSCFPKDVNAIVSFSNEHLPVIQGAIQTNNARAKLAVQLLKEKFHIRGGNTVAIWGLAFKPNTDDLRESPALKIINILLSLGVHVRVHDPVVQPETTDCLKGLDPEQVIHTTGMYECCQGADALLLATEWDDYKRADFVRVRGCMRGRSILDGRNVLNRKRATEQGFQYLSFGR